MLPLASLFVRSSLSSRSLLPEKKKLVSMLCVYSSGCDDVLRTLLVRAMALVLGVERRKKE